ncbi:hypothetical protein AQUCO_01100340v1 [Aquilegia coerulea]|uniref:Secreted protein n=1 Tax=Aquilegia coerulea TaxID=218851 RepID=A0A2G5E6T1_AQUCA|nr:hypothetical protein AQUCO_01100340v1 [Aquilegia coerulea]
MITMILLICSLYHCRIWEVGLGFSTICSPLEHMEGKERGGVQRQDFFCPENLVECVGVYLLLGFRQADKK